MATLATTGAAVPFTATGPIGLTGSFDEAGELEAAALAFQRGAGCGADAVAGAV